MSKKNKNACDCSYLQGGGVCGLMAIPLGMVGVAPVLCDGSA